jgi:uncharacterized protein GlcG (DUF336 family)
MPTMTSRLCFSPRDAAVLCALFGVACAANRSANATAHDSARAEAAADCSALPNANNIASLLKRAADSGQAGGLFGGRAEWAATVNRKGQICSVVAPSDSAGGYWPGSRSIAMAKAFTANGFSTDTAAMSTARLYTFAQPGHSLFGAVQPEPFNPDCLDASKDVKVCGGGIVFGGGLALYKNGRVVGGLGVRGQWWTTFNTRESTTRRSTRTRSVPIPGGTVKRSAKSRRPSATRTHHQ